MRLTNLFLDPLANHPVDSKRHVLRYGPALMILDVVVIISVATFFCKILLDPTANGSTIQTQQFLLFVFPKDASLTWQLIAASVSSTIAVFILNRLLCILIPPLNDTKSVSKRPSKVGLIKFANLTLASIGLYLISAFSVISVWVQGW